MSGLFVIKTDRSRLAAPIEAKIYEGRVARVHVPGDALMYSTGPEHRDVDEVANIVSQLPGLDIYLGHPSIFPAKDSGQKIVGKVSEGRLDEDTAVGKLVITDDAALAAIEAGTHELSLGYQCVLDEGRYQRRVVLDHLAIVERARCGVTCSMRVDVMEPVEPKEETVKLGTMEIPFEIIMSDATKALLERLGGKSDGEHTDCTCKNRAMPHNNGESMSDTNEDIKAQLDAALAEVAGLKTKLTDAEAAKTTLEVEALNARKDADAAKAQIEALEADLAKAKSDAEAAVTQAKADAADAIKNEIQARVDARVGLLVEAKRFDMKDADGKALDLNAMTDRQIKCAIIKHVDGEDIADDRPEAFVDGVLAGSLKRSDSAKSSREAVRTTINELRKDGAPVPTSGPDAERIARENMAKASREAWAKK